MSAEDIAIPAFMGVLMGGLAFAIARSRLRWWSRHGPAPVGSSDAPWWDSIFHGLTWLDLIWDVLLWLLVLTVLLYGAWVAPRVRIAVGVAAITVVACLLVRRYVILPLLGGRS